MNVDLNFTFMSLDNLTRDIWKYGNESSDDGLGPKRGPLSTVIPMTVVYAVILVTGTTGNVCTCIVIARNKYMHTATNYYLFSLAISDLLLLVLGLPQELYELWVRYPYIFGESVCVIRGLTSETSTNASILTITAFTVERYVAICHPLRAHTMSHLPRAIRTILAIWMIAAVFAMPLALQFGIVYGETEDGKIIWESAVCNVKRPLPHAFEISTFLFFVLPISVISILYVFIGLRLRMSGPGRRKCSPETTNGPGSGRQNHASRRAVVKMLVAVVISFFICWSPFHAQRLLAIYVTNPTPLAVTTYTILTYISGVTYYLSSTINPILYQLLSLKFRQAFKDTFGSCCFSEKNSNVPELTYTSTCGNHIDCSVKSSRHRLSSSFQQLPSFSTHIQSSNLQNEKKNLSASCANVCIQENVPEKVSLLGTHLTVSNV
ncbi:pyrokinin-1 receptor-like [Centruroides vittatus]|uniref:pyrokinin-1 receptor-like n=1 Tax=Centruroides vittatus TaxID=120091 RepID=UPI00350FCC2A